MSQRDNGIESVLATHPKLIGVAFAALLYAGSDVGNVVMNSVGAGDIGP